MGYTHLQPAEPTTLGYRFGVYAQDLLIDLEFLHFVLATIKGKGIKGAVGTGASYEALVAGTGFSAQKMEEMFCTDLGLTPVLIASQVNPRKYDFLILSALCSIAQSLSKFAFDLRIMQSPGFGEWAEPFGSKQVGSSAMPFKKNPLQSEKICSLGRYVSSLAPVAWENASLSLLERTLDDSANKRIIIPEAFLAVDEMLKTAEFVLTGLEINLNAISQNLDRYGLFSATERVIIEAVKKGAGRQEMHELLRNMSMKAWQAVAAGKPNPMRELLLSDKTIGAFLEPDSIEALLDVSSHVGSAPRRVRALAEKIREVVVRTGK
jgi:adenylosuccinate lyase